MVIDHQLLKLDSSCRGGKFYGESSLIHGDHRQIFGGSCVKLPHWVPRGGKNGLTMAKNHGETWSKSIWKWWFQTSFAFSIVYGIIPSHGLICFKMVKTTNQVKNCKNPRNGATGATPMVAGVGSCHTAMQRAFGSWTKLLGSNCSVLGDPKEGSHMKSQLRFVEYELQWVYCKLYYFHCSLPRAASVDKILSFWVWDSPECCLRSFTHLLGEHGAVFFAAMTRVDLDILGGWWKPLKTC